MNALQKAIEALDAAERYYQVSEEKGGDAHYRSRSDRCYKDAIAYAHVVSAESAARQAAAMERIAAVLENTFRIEGTDMGGSDMRVLNVNALR